MKRNSILILVAALVLAVSIPLFAFAESETAIQPQDGTGNMYGQTLTDDETTATQGNGIQLQDCDGDCDGTCDGTCDGDCEAQGVGLGNDGEAQHQNARNFGGQRMMLNNSENGTCDGDCDTAEGEYQNRRDLNEGGCGQHWAE